MNCAVVQSPVVAFQRGPEKTVRCSGAESRRLVARTDRFVAVAWRNEDATRRKVVWYDVCGW